MNKREAPNRINELRIKKKKWNQKELADAVNAHWVTISKLERGQMQLTQDWMSRLAKALDVLPHELISDSHLERTVYVDGWVDQSGNVTSDYFTDGAESAVEFNIEFGTIAPNVSLWYFATANMFGPAIRLGDLLRFTVFNDEDWEHPVGRICMLQFAEGQQLPLVGVLARTLEDGVCDVTKPDGETLRGLRPTQIAALSMVVAFPRMIPENDDL